MSENAGAAVKSSIFGLTTMITQNLSKVSEEQIGIGIDVLLKHRNNKILVVGAGRSSLVAKAFALRLLHLGYNVHVLGDTLVPSIDEKDLVIAVSGSGTTRLVVAAVEAAKHVGAKVLAVTSFPDSPLGRLADYIIEVKGRILGSEESGRDYFSRQILGLHEPLAPLGTLFEDSCMILFDAMVVVLLDKLKMSEEELKKRHANIE
ncbi:MAG: 6-phospho-3-hexuloisomerase [Nitrososphaerota archaeon]|nr:SIS domain-containing protein [Nitrososphaerales archaeon]MDW8044528.1 6-phospho-3-hexuloisomerase [Nitrososphaerota archaeon]